MEEDSLWAVARAAGASSRRREIRPTRLPVPIVLQDCLVYKDFAVCTCPFGGCGGAPIRVRNHLCAPRLRCAVGKDKRLRTGGLHGPARWRPAGREGRAASGVRSVAEVLPHADRIAIRPACRATTNRPRRPGWFRSERVGLPRIHFREMVRARGPRIFSITWFSIISRQTSPSRSSVSTKVFSASRLPYCRAVTYTLSCSSGKSPVRTW